VTRWILVVEDTAPLGEMICDNLHSEGYGTELCQDGMQALARLEQGNFDLVILDIMLPGCDGFEVLTELRKRRDTTPVMVLSARSSDDDRVRGLELQADDYLTKPFNLRELLLRVAALLRRSRVVSTGEDRLEFGGNSIDFRGHQLRTWRGEQVTLSTSQVRLLRMLSSRPGEVVTRREINEQLFGPNTTPTARTVDNLMLGLRKLCERDSANPVHLLTLRGSGWRFTP